MRRILNRIKAILKKQVKDTLKNKTVLLQFIIFPAIAFVMTQVVIGNDVGIEKKYFAVLFATMFAGMIPAINMVNIITEEKENDTLRVLVMSNVKPVEYLIGISVYVFIMCIVCTVLLGMIGDYWGIELLKFTAVVAMGLVTSIMLGGVIGIIARNQMSGSSVIIPISVVTSFLPMLSMFSNSIEKVSKYVYTQQIYYLINDLSSANFTTERIMVIAGNYIVFAGIFIIAYRKKGLEV